MILKPRIFVSINSLSFSENGNYIYVYHYTVKEVQIIDLNTLKRVDSIALNTMTYYVKFSPDGKYAGITNGDSTFSIWNLTNKTEIYKITLPFLSIWICNIYFNSEYFVVNYWSNITEENIEVYSMKTGNLVTKSKSNYKQPFSILLNDNHTILTSTIPAAFVEKFDINSNINTKININIYGAQMSSSSMGNYLAGKDSMNYLYLYDLSSEKPVMFLNKISENLEYCTKIVISPNNKSVFASGYKNSDTIKRGQIIEYDFETGKKINVFPISNSYLADMVLSKDGKVIYTVDSIGKIYAISNLDESQVSIKTYELKKQIYSLAISEDNTKLIAGGFMTGFYYINLKTDSINNDYKDPYSLLDFEPNIKTLALNKKGDKLLVAGNSKTIFVFKYNSETDVFYQTNNFKSDSAHNYYEGILQVAFSDDEKLIYCSSGDGYVHIFDAWNYKEINKIKINPDSSKNYPTSIVISKDNKTLIAGDIYSGLSIFDLMTNEKRSLLQFQGKKFDRINSIALSYDDNYLAFSSNDGSVGLYKIAENTSVNEAENVALFSIYPNPAKDYMFVQPSEGSDIEIFNILGEKALKVEQTPTSVQRIDISNLSPGMYFIKIGNRVEKFVKM